MHMWLKNGGGELGLGLGSGGLYARLNVFLDPEAANLVSIHRVWS